MQTPKTRARLKREAVLREVRPPAYTPAIHEDLDRLRKRVIWEKVEALQLLIQCGVPLPEK